MFQLILHFRAQAVQWTINAVQCSLHQLCMLHEGTIQKKARLRAAQGHGDSQQSELGSGHLYWPHSDSIHFLGGVSVLPLMKHGSLWTSELLLSNQVPHGILSSTPFLYPDIRNGYQMGIKYGVSLRIFNPLKSFRGKKCKQGTHALFYKALILSIFLAIHSVPSKASDRKEKKDHGEEKSWLVPKKGLNIFTSSFDIPLVTLHLTVMWVIASCDQSLSPSGLTLSGSYYNINSTEKTLNPPY